MGSRLSFLGTSDSQGVPRWWCECGVCREARETGANARTRPSVLLETGSANVLVDASPEFRLQATREGIREIGAVLVTHAHNDHILGLGDVLDFAWRTNSSLKVYAAPEVLEVLRMRFGYAFHGRHEGRVQAIPAGGLELGGWRVRVFGVPHGFNGVAHAFRFERDDRAWVYCTDAIDIDARALERWFAGLDLLVLGSSFWDESAKPRAGRSVYDVQEALEVIRAVRPARAVLTHLSHDVDARRELPENVRFAWDGLRLELW